MTNATYRTAIFRVVCSVSLTCSVFAGSVAGRDDPQQGKPEWCKNLPRLEYKTLEQVPLFPFIRPPQMCGTPGAYHPGTGRLARTRARAAVCFW